MDPLFEIPEDLSALSAEDLQAFIDAVVAKLGEIQADPASFVTAERSIDALKAEVTEAVEAVREARELAAEFEATEEPAPAEGGDEAEAPAAEPTEGDEAEAPADEPEPTAEASADEIAALAAEGIEEEAIDEPEAVEEPPTETEPIVAAAKPVPRRSRPARSRASAPAVVEEPMAPLLAAAGAANKRIGDAFSSEEDLARTMIHRRNQFGDNMPDGAENVGIAKLDWRDLYPEDRHLGGSEELVASAIKAVVNEKAIRDRFDARRKADAGSLVASGGLCAPVTPYYNLAMISVAERPVRAALPAFAADRGGIRNARPANLAAITSGVGALTAGQDAAGATKSCQSIDCPPFVETDVEILYHCLRFGNLGARTFPERVAQWNNLVLAAHARLGEQVLLSGIDAASTAVTANTLGLGASADLLSQVLVAAAGMRSRHRMAPDAVLRAMFPMWVLDLLVGDVYRSQFERFDMTKERFVSLLRAGGVEPTFYIDSAVNRQQIFGVQNAGALLNYPQTVTWYLFPEGSFLYLDGGILELGLVRDSVLNSTNDFEIFGESFENVAFIGVESLAITSTLCDSGVTSGTHNPVCPILYSDTQ
jgi:hypothetical protein